MNIILNSGTVYNAVSANFGETQPNGTKTYTALIYADNTETLLTDIVKGDFVVDNNGYEQTVSNMSKIISYMVNNDRGTIQVWLEEESETDKTISDLKAQLAFQENAFNDFLINILPEMMIDTTEGGTNG